jgi:hypothetical protein
MQITFYPKRLLITVLWVLLLWAGLSIALDPRTAGAITVVTSVAASVFFDLFFFVNPAVWGRGRRTR